MHDAIDDVCCRLQPPEGDWYCPICEKITKAESEETRSLMMSSLSAADLAEHLKFALKRLYAVVGVSCLLGCRDPSSFSNL